MIKYLSLLEIGVTVWVCVNLCKFVKARRSAAQSDDVLGGGGKRGLEKAAAARQWSS